MHNLIARNLLKTGYKLKVYEINPEILKNTVVIEGEKSTVRLNR